MSPKAAYLEKIPTEGIFHVRVFLSFLELMQENLIFSHELLAFFRNPFKRLVYTKRKYIHT